MQDYKRFDSKTVEIFVAENKRHKTDKRFLLCMMIIIGLFLFLAVQTSAQGNTGLYAKLQRKDSTSIINSGGFSKVVIEKTHRTVNWTSISDFGDSASGGASKAIIEEMNLVLGQIIFSVLISLGLSAITLILFRYYVGFIVWLMVGMVIALFVVISIQSFIAFADEGRNDSPALPWIASIFTMCLVIFFVAMQKNISLAIELYREAAKSVICMSKLLALPFITSILVFLVTGGFVIYVTLIEEASLEAPKMALLMRFYNVLVYCWFVQFLMGCQHMIVAGAVGKWFFTRDKTNLGDPVLGSAKNLWKFHMGTVAFGSLVIMTIKVLRSMIKSLKKLFKRCFCWCVGCCSCIPDCCFDNLGNFLEYLTHSAYVITSIFGLDFIDAGEKAFKMTMKHAAKIFMVHIVVKIIMFAGKLFVVGVTVWISSLLLSGDELENVVLIYVLNGLFAYIVIQGFFDTYEIAVDTIIIGFSADCDMNDGNSKPYYMSVQLVAFLERAKVIGGGNEEVPL